MADPTRTRAHRGTVVLSTIVAVLTIATTSLPVLRYLVTPWLIATVQAAMGADIDTRAGAQMQPLSRAFKSIIESRIRQLERDIAAMEYRRDRMPKSDWTGYDAQALVSMQQDLTAQREALAVITTPVVAR